MFVLFECRPTIAANNLVSAIRLPNNLLTDSKCGKLRLVKFKNSKTD